MRRQIPLLITLLVGTLLIVAVFLPPAENLGENFTLYFDIIAVFAFFLGGGNLLRVHLKKMLAKRKDWQFSIVTLVGFIFTLFIGLFRIGHPGTISDAVDIPGAWFTNIYDYIFTPLSSTMYALLAFFIASASYRAFRAKNREATILLVASFIILLGQTPLGTVMTSWIPDSMDIFKIPNMAVWILSSPNLAGQRAIMIGIGLGVVSMSMRLILGVERSYLGDDSA